MPLRAPESPTSKDQTWPCIIFSFFIHSHFHGLTMCLALSGTERQQPLHSQGTILYAKNSNFSRNQMVGTGETRNTASAIP